jgi:hypothetical protein
MRRARVLTLIATIGLISGGLFVAAPSAVSATPVWKIVKSPNPTGSPAAVLSSVSCPSPTSCIAVGYTPSDVDSDAVSQTLTERWNGKTWTFLPSPNPKGVPAAFLRGVACPSPTSCFAVGFANDRDRSFSKTLVEHWDGRSWAIQASPNPAGSTGAFLNGVTCSSARDCVAVGADALSNQTLVLHWNGRTWTIQQSPNPAGSPFASLWGVTCRSATNCYAVGYAMVTADLSQSGTLVEHWNGKTWSMLSSPNPAGSLNARLWSVSCPSATSCYAVGTDRFSKTLVEHWNGKHWAIQPSPNRSGSTLSSVSCPSTTTCYAVGDTGSLLGTFVMRWNGTAWTIQASPNPPGSSFASLDGVACLDQTTCHAVGHAVSSDRSVVTTLVQRYG